MKRIFYVIFMAALVAAGCQKPLEQFTVTPTSLEFSGEAGSQTVTVTASDTWVLKIADGGSWLKTSKTYGKSSGQVEVTVTANSPAERTGEIVFSCSGQSIKVAVKQAPGTAEEIITPPEGAVTPDPTS